MKHTWKIIHKAPTGFRWWGCTVCNLWFSERHLSEDYIKEYKESDDCDKILAKRAAQRLLK